MQDATELPVASQLDEDALGQGEADEVELRRDVKAVGKGRGEARTGSCTPFSRAAISQGSSSTSTEQKPPRPRISTFAVASQTDADCVCDPVGAAAMP
jgi:hypothetical protein